MANLIVQTAFIGDLLLAVPLMRKLKEFDASPLHLVCRKGCGEFLKSLGLVDEVYEMDKAKPRSLKKIQKQLKKIEFKNIICPHQSFRSAKFVSSLKAENKVGFYRWFNFFAFNKRIPRPMHLPDALRQMALLTLIDSDFKILFDEAKKDTALHNTDFLGNVFEWDKNLIPYWANPSIENTLKKIPHVDEQFTQLKPIIFLSPGSVWKTKKWVTSGYIKVAKYYKEKGYSVILLGAPSDTPTCLEIEDAVPGVINISGKTTMIQMLHILSYGKVLVANDSGAAHFASLVGLPTVSIFGPTTLSLGYRPWNEKSVIIQKELKCRPCGKHGSNSCPIGTHECMESINHEDVIEAINSFLYN